jgi:hypothetical protein
MNARHTLIAVAVALSLASTGRTQSTGGYPIPAQGPGSTAFASTPEEGALRGVADLGRAIGEQNYNSASAGLIGQDARTAAIENDYLAVRNWYKKKELHNMYASARRYPYPTTESLIRFSKERAPDRIATHQVNMELGAIYWPALLEEPRFRQERERLEALYEQRSHGSRGVGGRVYREVQLAADEMREELQEALPEVDPAEYMVAKKFIDSLAYEARFPVQPDSSAIGLTEDRPVKPVVRRPAVASVD